MDTSTKNKFYNFVDQIMNEVNVPPPVKKAAVSSDGKISEDYEKLLEYDDNMHLRVILSIISSVAKEGKLQELYWLLKNKYIDN